MERIYSWMHFWLAEQHKGYLSAKFLNMISSVTTDQQLFIILVMETHLKYQELQ